MESSATRNTGTLAWPPGVLLVARLERWLLTFPVKGERDETIGLTQLFIFL